MPDFTYRHNDLLLRFTGVLAIAIAVVALRQLYSLVHLPPHHEASLIELALAAIGFLGTSGGSALVVLGHHIFDEVVVARPWGRAASYKIPTRSGKPQPPIEQLSAVPSSVTVTSLSCVGAAR